MKEVQDEIELSSVKSDDSEHRAVEKTKKKYEQLMKAQKEGSSKSKSIQAFQDFDIMQKLEKKKKKKEEDQIQVEESNFFKKVKTFISTKKDIEKPSQDESSSDLDTIDEEEQLMQFENIKLRMEIKDKNEQAELRRQGILKYSDPYRERWDYFVMFLSIYNSGWLPYEQAFEEYEHCSFSGLTSIDYFNYSIDICFGIDIIINFSTTYVDPETGEEQMKRKDIVSNYLFGMFFIDFMATIPFYELFCIIMQGNMSRWVQMLAILKLIRVLRLQRVITYMNTTEDVKQSLQLVKTTIYLLLFIHFTACLWFYMANQTQVWVPGQTKLFGELGANLYTDFTPFGQLTICLYTSVLALCGNDILPVTNDQFVVSSVILVLGALFNAYMFGTIAVIFQQLNQSSQKFIEQLDIANTSMKNMHLPAEIQDNVREYLLRTQNNLGQQKELEEFLGIISPSLVYKVTQQIFLNAINNNRIFSSKSDITTYMIQQVSPQLALPEQSIISKNDLPDSVYFIAKGSCDVSLDDHMKTQRIISSLKQGDIFGEVALVFSCNRTATVKSQNYSTLAYLNQKDFLELWDYSPDTFFEIREESLKYNDPWIQFKIKLLEQVDYLEPFKKKRGFLKTIQFYMHDHVHQKDGIIYDFDQECNKIFFVVNGAVDLEIMTNEGNIEVLETLEQGDLIGQYSVLYHTKLVFRVVVRTTTARILTLKDDFFVEYGDKDSIPYLGKAINQAEEYEKEWGLPVCDFKRFEVEKYSKLSVRESLDVKLRIIKRRFLLMCKLNIYQRRLFDIAVNGAMDKAPKVGDLIKDMEIRMAIRKRELLQNQLQKELAQLEQFTSPMRLKEGDENDYEDNTSDQFGKRHAQTDKLLITCLNDEPNQLTNFIDQDKGDKTRVDQYVIQQKNQEVERMNQLLIGNKDSSKSQIQGEVPITQANNKWARLSSKTVQAQAPRLSQNNDAFVNLPRISQARKDLNFSQFALRSTTFIQKAPSNVGIGQDLQANKQIDPQQSEQSTQRLKTSSSLGNNENYNLQMKQDTSPLISNTKKRVTLLEEDTGPIEEVLELSHEFSDDEEEDDENEFEDESEEFEIEEEEQEEEGEEEQEEEEEESDDNDDYKSPFKVAMKIEPMKIQDDQLTDNMLDIGENNEDDHNEDDNDDEEETSDEEKIQATRAVRLSIDNAIQQSIEEVLEELEQTYEPFNDNDIIETHQSQDNDSEDVSEDIDNQQEIDIQSSQETNNNNNGMVAQKNIVNIEINSESQYRKKLKSQTKVSNKKSKKTKSQKGKLSVVGQPDSPIKVKQLIEERPYETERPNQFQIKDTSQSQTSSIVIPHHTIRQKSALRQRKSVQIQEEPSPEDEEEQEEENQETDMNEESGEYVMGFLSDMTPNKVEVKTQTDYKMSKDGDSKRETLDAFVQCLSGRK